MLKRNRFEKEYIRLFSEYGYGAAVWGALAGGILTGKYNEGQIPSGSRFSKHDSENVVRKWNWYMSSDKSEKTVTTLKSLKQIAKDEKVTQA